MVILCTIDLETREVSLPAGQVIASYDHNVDVIRFQAEAIPGFSLDTSSIKVAAQGPNKARHDYAVDPSTVSIEEETGYITFDWPIPAGVTEMPLDVFKYGDKGQLIFAVCAEIISGDTVSKAWHSDDGIITVVAHLEPEAGGGEDPEEEATNAQKIGQLQTDVAVINTQVSALGNGSPTPVATVAEMTDESAVYLYTGSETGYTAGNWYYYDGTEWTSGGTYGGAVTSTTFNQHGVPADDFAVGEALAEKADTSDVTALDTRVTAVEDALESKADADDVEAVNGRVSDLQSDLNAVTSELFTVSDNLFDFDSIIENAVPGPIGSSPDATVTLNGWKISNYIPVEAGQQYALILNGAITTGAIFRVACYANGIMTYKTSGGTEPNPFTIPSGVDHVRFFSNTASLFATRTATSFKKYSADMSLVWTPYGDSPKFASKDAVQKYGVYVDGTNYYHFVRFGEQTLIRLFKQEGPNNLFQFSALYIGEVSEHGVSINETIVTNGTDTVGPISIMRQGVDSGGMWSGGWHTRTVNGVACPTAEQQSLDIKINGKSIVGANGLHYGECVATVVNKLYFPQTITGSDLSTATQAIQETVTYILNEKMTARVVHKYVADTRVTLYYGMQAVRIGFNNILLPNNETAFAFADMTANINLDKPEDLMQMSNNDWNYDLIMKPFGLAKYTHNSGAGSTKYGYLPTATRKVYWALMEGTYDYTFITSGKVLVWEGEWNIYPN